MINNAAIDSIENSYFMFSYCFDNLQVGAVMLTPKPAVIGGLSKCKN